MGEMKDRIARGELYIGSDEDLAAEYERAQLILERYNTSAFAEQELRDRLLRELLKACGEGVHIRPPFRLEYGTGVSIGAGTFFNYDCLMLDVAPVTVGADCQVASRVQFITATHPIDPHVRRIGWETAKPITVGDNVWLSSGVILCPGVTIGDDTVVGAGAVVTRDLPAGVVAMGVPARVVREISERDRVDVPQL
jgi:maltose O-acetyltransferase